MAVRTSRIYLSQREAQVLLRGLEELMNRLAAAKLGWYHWRDPLYAIWHPEECRAPQDLAMFAKVLSARNILKSLNASRQPRLDALQFAAAALGLRLVRRESLMEIGEEEFTRLADKVERYRRRARRAGENALGKANHDHLRESWRQFRVWCHWNIFRFKPRRWTTPGNVRKQQREQTRSLALSMVTEKADPKFVSHLADLARREVRRGRHGTTLRELLGDQQKTVRFFKEFLWMRLDLERLHELLKPQFQPECLLAAARTEKMKAVSVVEVE